MNWLQELLHQHSELESPREFWFWSALCAVSAVVKDNVWLNMGGVYNVYPNIYVVFHADSGMKKGPPIALCKDLIRRVNNTRVISGRSSIQGIMKKLGTAYTEKGGKVNAKSVGTIISSELSASLVQDPAALTLLTDLYDRHYNEGEYESLLKMETFQLKDPTITLLGGINDAHAETFFEKKDINGGFYARTFVIHEKKAQTRNSLGRRLKNPPNPEMLSEYLKEIAQLKGPFSPLYDESNNFTEVGKTFDDWYNQFKDDVESSGVKDATGTLNRLDTSVIKIAMLLSLAKRPVLEIDMESMNEAIALGEKLVGNIRHTTMGRKGASPAAKMKATIIKELVFRENHSISRVMLMKKLWADYSDSNEFDALMIWFDQSGLIKTHTVGNQIVYYMPSDQVEDMKKFLSGKLKKDMMEG